MAKKKIEEKEEDGEVPTDNGKAAEVAIKSLQKKFGDRVINWFSEQQTSERIIVPTGSVGLDSALGVGGIVLGKLYEFYGPPSAGKSTLSISLMKKAIERRMKIIYVDAEHTLDKGLLLSMGIDTSQVAIVQAYTAEENLDIAEALMGTGEFSICVIDSISALQPSAEANLESFSDNTMGLHPRLMSRMCRTFTPLASRTNTALILINQIRVAIGSYGAPEETGGGKAIRHHVSGRIRVSGGGSKTSQIKNERGDVIGHRVKFEITKNKLAVPYRVAEVDLIYGQGFDIYSEAIDLAVDMGLVDIGGAWITYGGEKYQGKSKFLAVLRENKEMFDSLHVAVLKMLKLGGDE